MSTFRVNFKKNSNFSRQSLKVPDKTKKYVKKTIKNMAESKYIDRLVDETMTTSGILRSLNLIPTGSDIGERDGNEVTLRYLKSNVILTNGDEDNLIRVVVFRHKRGPQPVIADMPLADNVTMLDHEKFEVLYDKTYFLRESWDGTNNLPDKRCFHINRKLKNKIYFDTTANNSDVKGGIYLFVRSDSALAPNAQIRMFSRMFYKDL